MLKMEKLQKVLCLEVIYMYVNMTLLHVSERIRKVYKLIGL